MAVTYTDRTESHTNSSVGTSWALTAFTPAVGDRIIAFHAGNFQDESPYPHASITISDSQGLTWTEISHVGYDPSWAAGMKCWISSAVASAVSHTVTLGLHSSSSRSAACVFTVAGASGTIAGLVTDTTAETEAGYTVTLGATPTADDVCVFARAIHDGNDVGTLSMGSGWTKICESGDNGIPSWAVAVHDSLASTTVTITDTDSTSFGAAIGYDLAFIIRTAGGGGGGGSPPFRGSSSRNVRTNAIYRMSARSRIYVPEQYAG